MLDKIDTIETDKLIIEVYPDDNPESPREWDNLGTMTCFHRRYDLGDKHIDDIHQDAETFANWLQLQLDSNQIVALPLWLYDHSGITMRTHRNNKLGSSYWQYPEWDAGLVGYIYVTKDKIRKEYGCKRVSKQLLEEVTNILISEVEEYDAYLRGEVYGYIVKCKTCEQELESCWGFMGDYRDNEFMDQAKSSKCEDCEETQKRLNQQLRD